MRSLTILKWKDKHGKEKTFRLVDKVSSGWRDFGNMLGLTMNQLEAWEMDQCCKNSSALWRKVMNYWLTKGQTLDYPATWDGLNSLLLDLSYTEIARELKDVLRLVVQSSQSLLKPKYQKFLE